MVYNYHHMHPRSLILIAHNVRSCHNVGSLLRTADGIGVAYVYLTGYTPYPEHDTDERLPHVRRKLHRQIHKTALGAENSVPWSYHADITAVLHNLKARGYVRAALEQTPASKPLHTYKVPDSLALLVGREVEGIEREVLDSCDIALEIPMSGTKESFNLVQAAAMALFYCRFGN